MNGYDLARELRVIPQNRDALLIAVNGYDMMADLKAIEEAGFDHYFPKPPDIAEPVS